MKLNKLLPKFKGLYFFLKRIKYKWMGWKFDHSSDRIIQTASTTFFDRHPDLFKALSDLSKGHTELKILSFGSSTGEECQTLRKYFPKARIIGAEINKASRKKAIENNKDQGIQFIDSISTLIKEEGPFDIVFALSVLCKNPEAEYASDLSMIYPFSNFENMVNELNEYLSEGGWLVIRSSNYRFKDTLIYSKYRLCSPQGMRDPIEFPKFNSDGLRMSGYLETEEIFQKIN
ncbi:MAG: class I SAM-dependent methyltransferase [Bacteroidetes bacterium]|nr:class I SAM-dependent methyltransferase [Bacteroidota bacterium]